MTNEKQQGPERPDDDKPTKVSFSLPQILGGALAAVTVAVVGSTLGTAGTVIGAAIASVVGGIAGTLYTAGIDRTSKSFGSAVQKGWQRVRGQDPQVDLATGDDLTLVLEPVDDDVPVSAADDKQQRARTWRTVLLRVGVSAVAIFVVAFGAITAWEVAAGQTLSGNTGTTITGGGSAKPKPSRSTPAATRSAAPTTGAAKPSPTESTTEPTPTATTATAEPTPTTSATTQAPTPTEQVTTATAEPVTTP